VRKLTAVTAVLSTFTVMGLAAQAPKLSQVAQEILSIRKARMEAGDRKDAASWGRYVADGYTATDDGGALHTKAQIMEGFTKANKSLMISTTSEPEDIQVHLFGDTGVVNFRAK
jgi:Domain of unknown function (DUF4440)